MHLIFFVHSSVEGHLRYFQVMAITNNVVISIVEHMSLWYDCASFGYIPNCGIAGS